MMMVKANYFMILNPSPWPVLVSLNFFNMLTSLMLLFKENNIIFIFNILMMMLVAYLWFMDLDTEFNFLGLESLNLEMTVKSFFVLFIVSEIMVFMSLFWSYYCNFLSSEMEFGLIWPYINLKPFDWLLVPMINTLLLVSSSTTLTISHYYLNSDKLKLMIMMLIFTIILGFIFTFLQLLEYKSSYFSCNDSSYGSIFFVLTGLHGLHVVIGNLILINSLMKIKSISSFSSKSELFEMGSWYWHFVDLVWLFVLYSLYYINI